MGNVRWVYGDITDSVLSILAILNKISFLHVLRVSVSHYLVVFMELQKGKKKKELNFQFPTVPALPKFKFEIELFSCLDLPTTSP